MRSEHMHRRHHHDEPFDAFAGDDPIGPGRGGHRQRRGRGRGGPGPGPWAMGPGGPAGFGRRGGARRRKGAIRDAILSLLAEGPSNGYGLIRSIAERTEGQWTPSPGSVYPTLQQLVDEGLIEGSEDAEGRTEYSLTEPGRAHVEAHADDLARAWQGARAQAEAGGELRGATMALMGAVHQVQLTGTEAQVAAAVAQLDEARRALYRLLAE